MSISIWMYIVQQGVSPSLMSLEAVDLFESFRSQFTIHTYSSVAECHTAMQCIFRGIQKMILWYE